GGRGIGARDRERAGGVADGEVVERERALRRRGLRRVAGLGPLDRALDGELLRSVPGLPGLVDPGTDGLRAPDAPERGLAREHVADPRRGADVAVAER